MRAALHSKLIRAIRHLLPHQGRFKRPLLLDDVVTGQEFDRPYKNMRGCWLMEKVGGQRGGAFAALYHWHRPVMRLSQAACGA